MDLPKLIQLPDTSWVCPTEIVGIKVMTNGLGFQLQKRNNCIQAIICDNPADEVTWLVESINMTRK